MICQQMYFLIMQSQTEQHLYEDLVVEALRMYGHNVFYLPREIIEEDTYLK